MVTEKLQSLFDNPAATVLHENATYQFVIKSLPLKSKNATLIFTEGLSKYAQPVDKNNGDLKHIELYWLVPDYWNSTQQNWPVNWLNRIAQVPQKNKTWFGVGDTLPAGNPPEAVDQKLNCTYFILSKPLLLEEELTGDLWKDSPFQMLAVIPIFVNEFQFKNQYSSKALLQIFNEKKVTELIDVYRQPVARKKFMGIF